MVLVKQLPSVLEMILLKSFDMPSASRYTVTTLTSYAVVIGGLLLVFNTLGAQWSQLQWLVAALGVGIGVDYGIYIYNRLDILLNEGFTLREAYYRTLRLTGRAVIFTGFTLAIGVGTWIFSRKLMPTGLA